MLRMKRQQERDSEVLRFESSHARESTFAIRELRITLNYKPLFANCEYARNRIPTHWMARTHAAMKAAFSAPDKIFSDCAELQRLRTSPLPVIDVSTSGSPA